MKKYISMLLCAAVLTAVVTGCASDEVQSGNAPAAGGEIIAETVEQSDAVASPAQTPAVTTAATAETAIESEPYIPEETIVPEESNEVMGDDVPEESDSSDSTVSVPPVSTTMAITTMCSVPAAFENTAPEVPEETIIPEYIPLTANDIIMTINADGEITTATERFTVEFTYIGSAESEYCFGCDYSLKKWDNADGGWRDVKFAENAAFNALGYIIGKDSPKNSISVSLSDDFYAEPLTAGSYLLVKSVCDGVILEQTFEIKGEEDGAVIESESGTLTLVINEIAADKLVCSLAWPYPAVYEVMCNTSAYSDFCAGDTIEVRYAPMYKIEDFLFRVVPESISMSDFELEEGVDYKPVIYLYPKEETEVSVQLDYNGALTVTEPAYGDGWSVTAYPDGRILAADGEEYPYLFWEGEKAYELDKSAGFCVRGEDSESFLREKLGFLGLNESETADFLEFWLPHTERNAYNIIRFHGKDYTDNAALDISPKPDTVIRVYMTLEASDEYIHIAVQSLEAAPERSGFTVVEWGGSIG